MGRRARRFTVTGYLISGPNTVDYRADRDALVAALEAEGPGLLRHPTMGTDLVQPGPYTATERRERGGYVEMEMSFTEAGQAPSTAITVDTQSVVTGAAQAAIKNFQASTDIGNIAAGP
jgi:prophage DNA circulation protein